jgi:hypothetical protein
MRREKSRFGSGLLAGRGGGGRPSSPCGCPEGPLKRPELLKGFLLLSSRESASQPPTNLRRRGLPPFCSPCAVWCLCPTCPPLPTMKTESRTTQEETSTPMRTATQGEVGWGGGARERRAARPFCLSAVSREREREMASARSEERGSGKREGATPLSGASR